MSTLAFYFLLHSPGRLQIRRTVSKFRKTPSETDEADVDWIFLGGVMAFARVTWFEEGIDWSDDELLSFHFFSNHFVQKVFCLLSITSSEL